jgi:hypothetical protein
MVVGGQITITREGRSETFHPGDICTVPANYPHTEQGGPQGVANIVGRRGLIVCTRPRSRARTTLHAYL